MDYQSAKVAALMAGLEARVAGNNMDASSTGDQAASDAQKSDYNSTLTSKQENLPNTLSLHGNQATMNINPLILTNIQGSPYFKKGLYALKTFHEVVDEIYYKVDHLEPWERGSRKTSGQVGMCGGVRGVGAGGVASTAYCIMFKLFTMRITRRQLNVLLYHQDSPYIRGVGLLYIRYTQAPEDLFTWFEPFLDDEEEIDPRSGGGEAITIGEMARRLLRKLDWYQTMFPRIPVKYCKEIDEKMKSYKLKKANEEENSESQGHNVQSAGQTYDQLMSKHIQDQEKSKESSRSVKSKDSPEKKRSRSKSRSRSNEKKKKSSSKSGKSKHRSRSKDRSKHNRSRSRSRSDKKRKSSKDRDSKKKKSGHDSDRKKKSSTSPSRKRSRSADKKQHDKERKRSRSKSSDHKKSSKHKSKKSRKRSTSSAHTSPEKSRDARDEKQTKSANKAESPSDHTFKADSKAQSELTKNEDESKAVESFQDKKQDSDLPKIIREGVDLPQESLMVPSSNGLGIGQERLNTA